MAGASDSNKGRGRPRNPDHELVIEVALLWIEQGYPVQKAVRQVIDILDDFGGIALDDNPPVPGPTKLVKRSSKFARDLPRVQAAMTAWGEKFGGNLTENIRHELWWNELPLPEQGYFALKPK